MNSFPTRRTYLGILAASALCLSPTAHAQTYPTKLIRIIVPFPAGGATDTVARLLAEKMGPRLGQTIIVENKGGAAGILGTDMVVKARRWAHTDGLAEHEPADQPVPVQEPAVQPAA
jgi:tripartite-type tricarboxylate transporter receptor subunit TctC